MNRVQSFLVYGANNFVVPPVTVTSST